MAETMTVRMPDGTLVEGVPAGTTQKQLLEKLKAFQPDSSRSSGNLVSAQDAIYQASLRQPTEQGSPDAIARGTFNKYMRGMMNIPNTVAIAGTKVKGDQPPFSVSSYYTGNQPPQVMGQSPAADWDDQILPPSFTPQDFQAGAQLFGEGVAGLASGDFSEMTSWEDAKNQQALASERAKEQYPGSYAIGEGIGTGLQLVSGRAKFSKDKAMYDIAQSKPMQMIAAKTGKGASNFQDEMRVIADGIRGSWESGALPTWMRRTGMRAGEAGLEAYALSAINGELDPESTAAWSTGLQTSGSVALSALTSITGKSIDQALIRSMGAVAGTAFMLQMFKSAAPGGDDYILPSIESGFNKVLATGAIATMFGLAGYGRYTGKMPFEASNLPIFADAMTSIPRGAVVSTINGIKSDPRSAKIVEKLSSDPLYFGNTALRRFERAFTHEDVSLVETIDSLMDNKDFRTKFNEMN